jgi:hypothetical protein
MKFALYLFLVEDLGLLSAFELYCLGGDIEDFI